MDTWFHKQNKLIQVLLLLIPFINWIVEIVVRWSAALKSGSILKIVFAVIVTVLGVMIGWVDAIWTLLFNKLLLE